MKPDIRKLSSQKESRESLRQTLRESLVNMRERCIDCPKCKAECAFLKKYGTPQDIAQNYDPLDPNQLMLAYECSLCGLCGAVCPVGLKPEGMFLEMRREAVDRGAAPLPEHEGLLAYERRGTSKLFSYYMLPKHCHTVFFPGCTLAGTRPEQTIGIYNHLKSFDPSLGIVLDCCCKPSHDLGRMDYFTAMNKELKSFLMDHGVQKIMTACPNCHKIFQLYGEPFRVITIYESLVQLGLPDSAKLNAHMVASIHDPCVARSDTSIHNAVRNLANEIGITCIDMLHSRCKTLCCGEGGKVEAVSPDLAEIWTKWRCDEANGRVLLTYCAGCANKLQQKTPTFHILDAVLNPQGVASAKVMVSKAPWTYLNRLKMKRYLKKQNTDGVTRERTYYADSADRKKGWKRLIILLALAVMIGALHVSGGTRFLDQGVLRKWVESWGMFAPLLYILIYIIIGLVLICAVMLMPLIYRKYQGKNKKGEDTNVEK